MMVLRRILLLAMIAGVVAGCAGNGAPSSGGSWTSEQTNVLQACNDAAARKDLAATVAQCGQVERNSNFLPERRVMAGYRIAWALIEARLQIEALAKLEMVIPQLDALGPGAQMHGATARSAQIIAQTLSENSEQVVALADAFRRRYGNEMMPVYRQNDALTQVHKGYALTRLGRFDDASKTYDDLMSVFAQDPTPDVRLEILRGCFNSAKLLSIRREVNLSRQRAAECLVRYGDVSVQDGPGIVKEIKKLWEGL